MDKNLLNDATSSYDTPTPGYMLTEISRATLANYPAVVQLQEHLVTNLKKDNHNVKFKCLIIIKHVCRTGRPEFKREMSRHVEHVKECLQYKGAPDPIYGDENYKKVRDAAKDAMDAIFDSQAPITVSAVAAANRIQGMGGGEDLSGGPKSANHQTNYSAAVVSSVSSAIQSIRGDPDTMYAGHAGATDGSFTSKDSLNQIRTKTTTPGPYDTNNIYKSNPYERKPYESSSSNYNCNQGQGQGIYSNNSSGMQGIGNSPMSEEKQSWMDIATNVASTTANTVGSTISSLVSGKVSDSKTSLTATSNEFDGGGYTTNRGPNAHYNNQPTYNSKTTYDAQKPAFGSNSNYLNNWSSGNGNFQPTDPSYPTPGAGGMVTGLGANKVPNQVGRVGNAASDGDYEKVMIHSLCEASGLKPVPPEEMLQSFLIAAATLSPDIVGSCLIEELNSDAWQSRTKALLVIGALARNKGCVSHRVWWAEEQGRSELAAMLSDPKASVRSSAQKLVETLGGDVGASPPVSSVPARAAPRQRTVVAEQPATAPESAPPSAAPVSLLDDENLLFGGASQPPPPPPQTLDMFGGLAVAEPRVVPTQISAPAPAPTAPAAAAAATVAPQPQQSAFDLLSSLDPTPVSTPPPKPAFNLLDLAAPPQPPPQHMSQQTAPLDMFGSLHLSMPVTPAAPYNRNPNFKQSPYSTQRKTAAAPPAAAPYMYPSASYSQQQPTTPPPLPSQMFMTNTMVSVTANRKVIPDSLNAVDSGFSFMGGAAGAQKKQDSFSFIADEVKASANKKK